MNRYKDIGDFARAFAAEYKGFMKACGITNLQLADKLERNDGYVSERVNGKRALDTADVDALAELAGSEWTGKSLMIELARRARVAGEANEPVTPPLSLDAKRAERNVRGPHDDAPITAEDMLEDAGVVDYPGRDKVAASEGILDADRIEAADENPEPAPEDD